MGVECVATGRLETSRGVKLALGVPPSACCDAASHQNLRSTGQESGCHEIKRIEGLDTRKGGFRVSDINGLPGGKMLKCAGVGGSGATHVYFTCRFEKPF